MPVQHVLVVDDSKSARLMLRKILQNLGMTVDTADSAEEALDYLRGHKPDAIFMDHTMPGMDGLAALRRIRSTPDTATIPVAMYTSKDEPAFWNEVHAAGAVGVLSKPATPEALRAILEKMNALLAAAARPLEAVPAPTGEGVAPEWIEKLIVEKSERIFYDAIESQVLPLINDVVAKLRTELELNQEEAGGRIATRILEKRLATWQPPSPPGGDMQKVIEPLLRNQLPSLLAEGLKTFQREGRADLEQMAREIATQVCQSQLHEFTDQLLKQLSARFAEAARKASAAARESAVEAACEAARETALQAVAEAHVTSPGGAENPVEAASRAVRELWTQAQHDLQRRVYLAAGSAAAVGIGAAALVYMLG